MKTYTLYGFTKDGKRVACATTEATSKEDAEEFAFLFDLEGISS